MHLLAGAAAALVAPAYCGVCSLPLVRAAAFPVCTDCLDGLEPSRFAQCSRCGEDLGMESERAAGLARTDATVCETCMETPPEFVRALAFGTYGGALRTMIHLHKFDGVKALAQPLGLRLARIIECLRDNEAGRFTIIAVPMYRGKRAYNQSALIADVAIEHLKDWQPGWRVRAAHRLLRRTRKTESQSHLTPAQRRKNVRGAFAVTGDVRGQAILLVDDVYTTGATAAECTRVLLQAGAAQVYVVTLARTQKEQIALWDGGGTMRTDLAAATPVAGPAEYDESGVEHRQMHANVEGKTQQ